MITGASRAEAALLVIDANEGVRENSRRHGYMLSMLGIKKIVVAINKLDLAGYSENVFNRVKEEYGTFLEQLNVAPMAYIPISAFNGDNVALKSGNTPWYTGLTILEAMDAFPSEPPLTRQVFRMPVQDVYKFTKNRDDRRIVAGTIETGFIKSGCAVVFYPSGKSSKVKSIECFPQKPRESASAGQAAGFTLEEQIYIKRGEIMTIDGETPPQVSTKIKVNIFWLGKQPMLKNKKYLIKIGSEKTGFALDEIISVMNSSDLGVSAGNSIKRNEVAECIIRTDKPIAFDLTENIANTSRFVIVDNHEIAGGGIILLDARDEEGDIQRRVILRNYKWEQSEISMERRAERYCQKPVLFVLTGERDTDKKHLAKGLESSLVESGRFAYYLGIGTFLYGVASDIKQRETDEGAQKESIRRFAEVANLMLDAGMILIITASSLTAKDLKIMRMVIAADIETIWVGKEMTTDLEADIMISTEDSACEENVQMLREFLKEKGYMFKF
jgi:bifunctional enzyme CysN/CysC